MDLISPNSAPALVMLGFRVGGLLLIAPVFATRNVPNSFKAGLIVLLTWLMHPAALAAVRGSVVLTPAQLFGETLIGMSIGLGAAVLVAAAEAMGDLMSVQIGLSGAAVFDPISNSSVAVLGQFANLFAVTSLLSLDGHLLMLDALAKSLSLIPLSSDVRLTAGLAAMVSLGSTLFALGLQFAAPVVATVLLANVALAVLTRAAPQLNVLAVAFPLQIGIGLLALAAAIPLISSFFAGWTSAYEPLVGHVLNAFSGGR